MNKVPLGAGALWLWAVLWAGPADAGTPASMTVQVRNGELRSSASFLSKPSGPVEYGSVVSVLAAQGAWRQVRTASNVTGWIHESSLTTRKLEWAGGDSAVKTGAHAGEVSLAAKGFTDQVEKEYKTKNPELNFQWVDRMERIKVTPERAAEFLQAGGVKPSAGGVS